MSLSQPEWEGLVAEWRRSGKSASQFAAERGLVVTALRYWINRPTMRSARPRAATVKGAAAAGAGEQMVQTTTLARVVRPGDAPPAERAPEIRVVVGRFTVIVEPGFDDVHLRAVVRALGELE